MADFCERWLATHGFEIHHLERRRGRPSLVAIAHGSGGGRSLMLNGHLDTVGVADYDGDALVPQIRHGKMFGRGAFDMKSGIAAMMCAAARATAQGSLRGDVILACVADEEHASSGTQEVLESFTADAAIVIEPSHLEVTLVHKGFIWFDVEIQGRAAYGSRPALGIDAIVKAGYFLTALEAEGQRKKTNITLVEGDAARLERLRQEGDAITTKYGGRPQTMEIGYHTGKCAATLLPALADAGSMTAPIFAFLDSWGGPDIPLDIARSIAAVPSSEVIVTFGTRFLLQLGNAEAHQAAGDKAFGGTRWREVRKLPSWQKKTFLVSTYRDSLKEAGFPFVLSFEMLDEGGRDIHLVYGTTSHKGLEKTKEAVWKVDPVRGIGYRDPRDPDQTTLDPETRPLQQAILAELGKGERTLEQLREMALLETVYRPSHVPPVVRRLLSSNAIQSEGS
ncbi:three-Cys-motif partner protein TcmP [Streptosporangium longisporum]